MWDTLSKPKACLSLLDFFSQGVQWKKGALKPNPPSLTGNSSSVTRQTNIFTRKPQRDSERPLSWNLLSLKWFQIGLSIVGSPTHPKMKNTYYMCSWSNQTWGTASWSATVSPNIYHEWDHDCREDLEIETTNHQRWHRVTNAWKQLTGINRIKERQKERK